MVHYFISGSTIIRGVSGSHSGLALRQRGLPSSLMPELLCDCLVEIAFGISPPRWSSPSPLNTDDLNEPSFSKCYIVV